MYGSPPPGAWQPALRHRGASLGVAFACAGLAIPALVVMLLTAHDYAMCTSALGQLAQSSGCSATDSIHMASEVALIVLAVACVIATLTYLPFAFVNLFNPLISAFYGYTGLTMHPATPDEPGAPGGEPGEVPGEAPGAKTDANGEDESAHPDESGDDIGP